MKKNHKYAILVNDYGRMHQRSFKFADIYWQVGIDFKKSDEIKVYASPGILYGNDTNLKNELKGQGFEIEELSLFG